jgi:hypothetical protein
MKTQEPDSCKDIRDEYGSWLKIEGYIRLFNRRLTRSICRECQKRPILNYSRTERFSPSGPGSPTTLRLP